MKTSYRNTVAICQFRDQTCDIYAVRQEHKSICVALFIINNCLEIFKLVAR